MGTIPATFPPRQGTTQQINYIRKTVNLANFAGATTFQIGSLPLNAFITDLKCDVVTAWNAGTTNVLTLGVTKASANELMAAGDITEATPGVYSATTGLGTAQTQSATAADGGVSTAEGGVAVYVKFTQTGTAATTGQATFIVAYVPDNDG